MNTASSQKIFAAASLTSMLLVLGGCGMIDSSEDRADRAEEMYAHGNYRGAAIELKNALDKAPDDARLKLQFARTVIALGTLDNADKLLSEAAQVGADASAVGALRAQVLFDRGRFAELLAAVDGGTLVLNDDTRDDWRARALGALNRCEEAIPLARSRLIKDGGNGGARVVIGGCYAQHGNVRRGLAELEEGARAAPRDAEVFMELGRLQSVSGKRAQGEASWHKALELAPGQLSVTRQVLLLLWLADAEGLRGDAAAMRAAQQKLAELSPEAPLTVLVAARVQLMHGEIAPAVNSLRSLSNTAPDQPVVHVLLASANLALNNIEQARKELAWLEQNAPANVALKGTKDMIDGLIRAPADSEEFWIRIAAAQAALGQIKLARSAATSAELKAPHSTKAGLLRVQFELHAGNDSEALKVAQALAASNPGNATVIRALAETLRRNARFAEADKLLAELYAGKPSSSLALALHRNRLDGSLRDANAPLIDWLAKNPDDLQIRGALADAMRVTGDISGAIAEYSRLAERAPQNPVVLNNLAWVLHLRGDSRALTTARQAWQNAPNAPSVADTYGWILVESNSVAEGLPLLEKANAAAGIGEPDVRYHYAAALARAGNHEQARSLLASFVQEWPGTPNHEAAMRLLASLGQSGGA